MDKLVKAVLCAAFALFATNAHADNGRWLRAESPHFIVYGAVPDAQLRDYVENLENFDALLRHLLEPAERPELVKPEIYLTRRAGDLEAVWPGSSGYIAGFYRADPDFVGAFVIQDQSTGLSAQEVLYHEYAHHFMYQYFANAYPTWFVEGFAEFVETAEVTPQAIRVGNTPTGRGIEVHSEWLPIERFLAPTRDMRDRRSWTFYGESWIATHYLMDEPARMQQFARYLQAIQSGTGLVEAFEPAFGQTPQQFERALHNYVRDGIRGFELPAMNTPEADIHVTQMPPSYDNLLALVAALRMEPFGKDDAEKQRNRDFAINRVERNAARYPDDPFAVRARARAALLRKSPSEARALLEPLIAANAQDVEALDLMGMSYVVDAERGEAAHYAETAAPGRRYFARVFRIAPSHAASLFHYAETFAHGPGPMPDGPLDVLTQAHLLAPQVSEISMSLGLHLMEAGRFDEAITVLQPVAYSPHESDEVARAKEMLEAARQHQMPPPPAPAETPATH